MSERRRRRTSVRPAPEQPPRRGEEPSAEAATLAAPEKPEAVAEVEQTPVIAYGLTIALVALLLVCALAIFIATP